MQLHTQHISVNIYIDVGHNDTNNPLVPRTGVDQARSVSLDSILLDLQTELHERPCHHMESSDQFGVRL